MSSRSVGARKAHVTRLRRELAELEERHDEAVREEVILGSRVADVRKRLAEQEQFLARMSRTSSTAGADAGDASASAGSHEGDR